MPNQPSCGLIVKIGVRLSHLKLVCLRLGQIGQKKTPVRAFHLDHLLDSPVLGDLAPPVGYIVVAEDAAGQGWRHPVEVSG